MTFDKGFFDRWTARALGLLRIVAAFLFLQHGSAKLLHVPHDAMFDQLPLFSLIGVAGVIEIIGSVLLLIGLFTRPAAFILSGEMAVAYFMAHAPHGTFSRPRSTMASRRCSTASYSCCWPWPEPARGAWTQSEAVPSDAFSKAVVAGRQLRSTRDSRTLVESPELRTGRVVRPVATRCKTLQKVAGARL